tara:strand:+ start:2862 stop:6578 length:3717 start_codon:yes stop_codon:yes gene_type:complete
MSNQLRRRQELLGLYDQLPGGQTQKERKLYGFIPGEWLPNWVKQGYNQSIEGMARQVMSGEPVFNVEEGYDPNMAEDILATVMSFATPTDFASLALGGGIGTAAIKGTAVKTATKEFAARAAVKSGMERTAAVRLVNQAAPKILNQARAKALTGATGLGFYSGLQSSLGQKITNDDISLAQTLQDVAKGATLGAATGGVGGKVSQATAVKALPKYQKLGVEKAVETGVFGTVSPALEGKVPTAEDYMHAAGVIGGLTLKRAVTQKAVSVPKKMINESRIQKNLRESAEAQAKEEARRDRGAEEWSDGKKNVRILTDYTGKERNQQQFVVEDVSTNKTFNIPKKNFFQSFSRTKDRLGDNIELKTRKRIFGLKKSLNITDVEFKQLIDVASGQKDPFPLRKKKGKSGYHSNYNELKTPEQRYRLLNQLESSKRTNEILAEWKASGIEIRDVSGTSLLKKALPPSIYESLQATGAKIKEVAGPSYVQMTDAISQSGVKLMGEMDARNSLMFSRLMTKLNQAEYRAEDGKVYTFKKLSGVDLTGKKKRIREQIANDMEGVNSAGERLSGAAADAAQARALPFSQITKLVYRLGSRAGLDLAPFIQNYFPKVIKKDVIKALYKDIDRLADTDARVLSADVVRKQGFEQNLRNAIGTDRISSETKEALLYLQERLSRTRKREVTLSEAFESLRNEVLSERVILNKNLEKERGKFNLPINFYERDSGSVLANYISQATKRIAYSQVVGKDGKGMYTKIRALSEKKLHKQAEILKKAFDTYTGIIETDKSLNYNYKTKSFLNNFVNFQVATKIGLGFATIPNITQTFISTALRLGYSPFFKGSLKSLQDKEYIKTIEKYTGTGTIEMHNIIIGFQSQQGTKLGRLADATTKAFGFQGINRVNKLVSAYSALEAAKIWQQQAKSQPKTLRQARRRDFAIRNLREMGVKDLTMKMTPKTMAKVMYEFARDAQLQKNVFLEPAFFANPKMQPFLLFKRFGYRQAEMITRWANQARKDKDMAFFLRLGAAGFAGGIFVNWAKASLSNILSGEDIYDDSYKFNVDGMDYTMDDFIQGLGAVGSFGLITDIISAESKWRTAEFLLKPAIIQDSMKMYSAAIRIGKDMMELGPNSITARRAVKYVSPMLGTAPRRIARRFETPKQRADRRKTMLTSTKKKIFDFMLEDNDTMVKRAIQEWNAEFEERPLMMDDISPEEINKYLMNKYTRLEREMIDPATQSRQRRRSSSRLF